MNNTLNPAACPPQRIADLPNVPGGWVTREFDLGHRTIRLILPAIPDAFLDDPEVQRANRESDYMPYWAYLWPASVTMARMVLTEPWRPKTRALEIGTGVGLVGIAALAAGLDLTLSDYDPTSIATAQQNSEQNGFPNVPGLHFDWRRLDEINVPPFDVILGCEVIYEAGNHPLVLDVLDKLLSQRGVCWIGDPGRQHAPPFCKLAAERGYQIELRDQTGQLRPPCNGELDFVMSEFRLLVVTRS